MSSDTDARLERIEHDAEFQALVRRRSRFAWGLSSAMAAIYFGFILTVAFAPGFLAMPLGKETLTVGIPLGVGVILAAFVLTGLYVRRANTDFDVTTQRILERIS
ncbi:MAG: DUF485 domain-containing protein [Hyphomicrobium zavarzinii]|jgi:uncharacterized membrane protein (DUF485 family)|uniref:DUF485 domain-containing protein n=1 Tax=Hyphomicrobium TaxID=81 RepID=UPI000361B518|nr:MULTISPECIES: DUF485 domain-containing protein [Hyphomicrobium]MBL8847096.1 DUF485 domain-containing protein [Hyphomicrobium zavarzinii]WBT40119.1 DUF485 domain-containing protein [Hyphomicrobium sp. DMF-1]HML42602.1 DUF485 domain-containing protein [Hyphomicrobium zavarzinii]